MQPVIISIEGDFWDSQIYKDRLYIWSSENSLMIIDWEKFINWLIKNNKELTLALFCAFCRSDILYRNFIPILFRDEIIQQRIQDNLEVLSGRTFNVKIEDLQKFLLKEINNPFNELTTDTEIFSNKIYASTDEGLSYIDIKNAKKLLVDRQKTKIWDQPLFSIKASKYGNLALSAGSEGLFEHSVYPLSEYSEERIKKIQDDIFFIKKGHSLFTNWIFSSIYNSSDIEKSYLAHFKWRNKINNDTKSVKVRYFTSIIYEDSIFGNIINQNDFLSWGANDKIYKIVNDNIYILKYSDRYNFDIDQDSQIQKIKILPWKGKAIYANTAFFGSIVECENALIVLRSDDRTETINKDITNWRVFPRSKYYLNQLHIISDNSLDIYSYNHDYFVDQKEKDYGIRFNQNYLKSKE